MIELALWLVSQDMIQMFFAGACGGLVRWWVTMERWEQALRHVGVGALTAAFLGSFGIPLLQPVVDFSGAGAEAGPMASGFVIGLVAVAFIATIIDTISKRGQLLASRPPPDPPQQGGQ